MPNFNTSYLTPNPKFSPRNFFGIKIDIGDLDYLRSNFFFCEILLLLSIYRIQGIIYAQTMAKIPGSPMIPNMSQLPTMVNEIF
jgi:hypothetical protein